MCCAAGRQTRDCLAMHDQYIGRGARPADGVVWEKLDQHAQQREREWEKRASCQVPAARAVCRRRSCCYSFSSVCKKSE